MIDTAYVQYIDVQEMFFDVKLKNPWCANILFDGEDEIRVIMNRVMMKADAVCVAESIFKESKSEYAALQISRDALKAGCVTDYFGNKIFCSLNENVSGWLVFFDPTPFANWDHPCKYLFVIDEDNYEICDCEKGLNDKIQLDEIF